MDDESEPIAPSSEGGASPNLVWVDEVLVNLAFDWGTWPIAKCMDDDILLLIGVPTAIKQFELVVQQICV